MSVDYGLSSITIQKLKQDAKRLKKNSAFRTLVRWSKPPTELASITGTR